MNQEEKNNDVYTFEEDEEGEQEGSEDGDEPVKV